MNREDYKTYDRIDFEVNNIDEKEQKNRELENQERQADIIRETGQVEIESKKGKIYLLSIIGEVEGHDVLSSNSKTTKYEHVLPKLAEIEENDEYSGVLIIINTVGGDVESGLAIAEMISSLSKPKVSLVLGGSHSIGVPLAVSADYSFIVPTGTMVIHPVRMNGMFIGAPQTYEYFKLIQDRIVGFVITHCKVKAEEFEEMMLNKGIMTKDLGTILVGSEAVEKGIIDELGGISKAFDKLYSLIEEKNSANIKY